MPPERFRRYQLSSEFGASHIKTPLWTGGTYVFVGLATPPILGVHGKTGRAQTTPDGLLGRRVVELERHLRLRRDWPDSAGVE
jgi:hypothetical protein